MNLLLVAVDGFAEDSEAASCARALARLAGREGLTVEVVSATRGGGDPAGRLDALGFVFEDRAVDASATPRHLRAMIDGVPVSFPAEADAGAFVGLSEASIRRLGPVAVIVQGTGRTAREVLALARSMGVATAVPLHDLRARDPLAFEEADAVLVPSRFAADFYAEALGLRCSVVPTLVDPDRAIAERLEPRFVTFVDPSSENGASVFARIADELGRRRPDIPLLIVGSRGSGATLANSGIDVLARGNVSLMERTASPRDHWRVTRVALVPTLAWDASPRVLAEAIGNGIPAVASDRGGLPELLGGSGASLAIPDRITPATKDLPTPDEVGPWVEAIAGLWDGPTPAPRPAAGRPDHPSIGDFLRSLRTGSNRPIARIPGRARSVVLVPFHSTIERPCEESLRSLEAAGVKVVRSEGCPQIDVARNMMASDALNAGAESILFIDADLGFDPLDALRLLARPEPVVSGVYAKKRLRALASVFADGIAEVTFGEKSPGAYPLKYAAGGFLRIKAEVLRRVIAELELPACNTGWGRRDWPFFLPMAAPMPDGSYHYLGEDWAFSHRLRQIGITPLADTSIRLWHHGPHAYGWEDAGAESPRHASYVIKIEGR